MSSLPSPLEDLLWALCGILLLLVAVRLSCGAKRIKRPFAPAENCWYSLWRNTRERFSTREAKQKALTIVLLLAIGAAFGSCLALKYTPYAGFSPAPPTQA